MDDFYGILLQNVKRLINKPFWYDYLFYYYETYEIYANYTIWSWDILMKLINDTSSINPLVPGVH